MPCKSHPSPAYIISFNPNNIRRFHCQRGWASSQLRVAPLLMQYVPNRIPYSRCERKTHGPNDDDDVDDDDDEEANDRRHSAAPKDT